MPVLKTRGDDATWHETSATSDADAIHDNVSSEISAVTEKGTPVNADLVLIEDSEDGDNKKRAQLGNLPDAHPVADTTDLVKGSAEATKLLRIEVDGLTTGTTRTITMADQNVDLTPDSGTYPAFATAVALAVAL